MLAVLTQTASVKVYGVELSVLFTNSMFKATSWVLAGSQVILFWSGCAATYRLWTGRNWPDLCPRPIQVISWFSAQVCLVMAIYLLAGLDPSSVQDQVEALRTDQWTAMVIFAAVPAIYEEVIFRGAFQRAFAVATGSVLVAAIAQSMLFVLGHLPQLSSPMAIAYFFFSGLWYSVLRIHTKTLWSSIGAHFGLNMVALGVHGGVAGSNAVDGYAGAANAFFGIAAVAFAILTLMMSVIMIRRTRESNVAGTDRRDQIGQTRIESGVEVVR